VIFSRSCEHGINVVLYLAVSGREGFIPVRTLAQRCSIPFHFLGKICGQLTHSGILQSHKGPNGGVALGRPMSGITLLQVVDAIDGLEQFDGCVLGLEPCSCVNPCPVHEHWAAIKASIQTMLASKTLDQLASELAQGKKTLKTSFGGVPKGRSVVV